MFENIFWGSKNVSCDKGLTYMSKKHIWNDRQTKDFKIKPLNIRYHESWFLFFRFNESNNSWPEANCYLKSIELKGKIVALFVVFGGEA